MSSRRLGDRGSVVAEFAVALPAVVLVLMLGAGALGVASHQVRLQDATADAARLAARGEPDARVRATIEGATPGARAGITHRHDLVCVTAAASAPLAFTVSATSCALAGGW